MPWAALKHLLAVPHDMLDKKHAALAISKSNEKQQHIV
jgi:hypothetical protein